ncbi:hypothetical protein [Bradyrhizobium sp. ORS 111]|uniref:hypothetical protein n=1 Tax=Bradyrhizobium sp. ORS 111 TaxID=1685958 RepID=UPI00388F40E1
MATTASPKASFVSPRQVIRKSFASKSARWTRRRRSKRSPNEAQRNPGPASGRKVNPAYRFAHAGYLLKVNRRRASFRAGRLRLLHLIELGVEHGLWHLHPLIGKESIEFVGVSVRRAADHSQSIEEGEIQLAVAPAHCAPDVPRQHLAIVQRGDVANEIAGDEPKSVHVENAECARVVDSVAAEQPGITGDHELIAWDVRRIEPDLEQFALMIVDLRLSSILAEVRARGYGTRDATHTGGYYGGPPHADGLFSIAVPLRDGQRVLGAINMLWLKTAFSIEAFAALHLGELQDTAEKIVNSVRGRRRR